MSHVIHDQVVVNPPSLVTGNLVVTVVTKKRRADAGTLGWAPMEMDGHFQRATHKTFIAVISREAQHDSPRGSTSRGLQERHYLRGMSESTIEFGPNRCFSISALPWLHDGF